MRSRKERLQNSRLYLILDREVNSYEELFKIVQKATAAGVDIIQLRDKFGTAQEILDFSKRIRSLIRGRVLYIINDRVDLAILAKADGVHVGQEDIRIKEAKKLLGKDFLIGASCQTMAQAKKAQVEGADYIGFGSIFRTLTKPERIPQNLRLVKKVFDQTKIPVFAIGGIGLKNISQLTACGINRVSLCRAVCCANNIYETILQFKEKLRK